MALFINMEMGDVLDIDDGRVQITFQEKSGRKATVRVEADPSVRINQIKKATKVDNRRLKPP